MKQSDFRRWAMMGAQQRLAEIANEQGVILAAFPELRGGSGAANTSVNNGEAQIPQRKRRRFRMSAAARKRISDAQKARWAKQKAERSSHPAPAPRSRSNRMK
jgi:hypothetical protein